MSKWSEVLADAEARYAENDRAGHAAFVRACARAFAGTGFAPVDFNAWNAVDGPWMHSITLKLTVRSIMDVLPLTEMLPRPAGVPDPRFHLRGQHAKRGRHAKNHAVFRAYQRARSF